MDEMTDRELDKAITEKVMGWKRATDFEGVYWDGEKSRYLSDMKAKRERMGITTHEQFWSPSTNLIHAATVEARIKEMGLDGVYGNALCEIVFGGYAHDPANNNTGDYSGGDIFVIATATPRQRMLAALAAIGHAQEKE